MDAIGMRTIPSLLQEQVKQNGNKTFLLFEDANGGSYSVSYEEFDQTVKKLINVLCSKGIRKGDKVLLHLPNSLDFMYAWFAITSMGAVMVPTNILSPKSEMDYLISHSNSKLIITEEAYLDKFTEIVSERNLEVLLSRCEGREYEDKDLQRLLDSAEVLSVETNNVTSDDVAAILYTSGTTSKPKGVLVTHANYIYAGEYMSQTLKMRSDDRGLIVLPMFHGNGQYYLTMPLLTVGGSIALTEKFSASRYFEQAESFKATIGSLFAAPIKMILRSGEGKTYNHKLKTIIFAQSVTAEQLEQFEQTYEVGLLQIYGMTETIGTPLMNPLDGVRTNMSIGKPGIGYEVKLVDEDGKEVENGEVGQIIVKGIPGRTLMKGYFENEEKTKASLQDEWLYTGDNARIGDDGCFYFVDRMKDMVKRAGENIATSEIEDILNEHPHISDSAVIGVPDEMRDVAIKAFIIQKEDADLSEEEVISYCKERLASFKVPEEVQFVDEFPRTSVGKIQKHQLLTTT
ncbi:AMP-binding protein [Bacillus tianshenii]|nr:AMP-binding protein [Bacillus tianshenii]